MRGWRREHLICIHFMYIEFIRSQLLQERVGLGGRDHLFNPARSEPPGPRRRRPPAGSGAPCSGRPTARAEGMDTKVPELLMDALGEPKWGTACVWDATLPARPHALVRPLHTHPHTRLHSALDSPPCSLPAAPSEARSGAPPDYRAPCPGSPGPPKTPRSSGA